MSKRLAILLILAAVLLTAFSVALSRRDSRDWRANRSRRLFPFPWQDTVSITIERPGLPPLAFKKNPKGEWQILLENELSDSLGYQAVDEFAALATLTWREPLQEGRPPNPDRAVVLTAASVGGQQLRLVLGDAANNLRTVAVNGDATLYGVSQDLLNFLDWPAERWRNVNLASAGSGRQTKKITLAPRGSGPELGIVLERTDAGWRQTAPVAWPVDEARLDLLLRWLDRLRAESIEAELTADLPWFGFTPESAAVEIDYDGPAGPARRRVEFGGDAGGDRVYVRETGRQPIFAISRAVIAEISLDVASEHSLLWSNFYRRRAINAIGEELPAELTVERLLPTPAKLTILHVRDREGTKWRARLEENGTVREFAVDPPDPNDPMRPLSALITGMSSIRIKTFLADTPPGRETVKWTAYPAWRFGCQQANGERASALTLYAAKDDGELPPGKPFAEGTAGPREIEAAPGTPGQTGIAFSLGDQPAVMEMHGDLAYLLCLPPYRYQSRQLLDSDPRKWERVEITSGDRREVYSRDSSGINEQWWRDEEKSEPLMEGNNPFVALLLELSHLRSEGFVADADSRMEEFGLDRPKITAIVYVSPQKEGSGEDGRLFKLTAGNVAGDPGGSRFARLNDSGPLFLLSGRLAEALGKTYN